MHTAMRLRAALLSAILLLAGCVVAPPVTPAMLATTRGASADALNRGRDLYGGRCTNCHSADPIHKYSLSRWREITEEMAPKAKLRPDEKAALLAYIEAAHAMPKQ